jgi:hypothetical protein
MLVASAADRKRKNCPTTATQIILIALTLKSWNEAAARLLLLLLFDLVMVPG